MPWIGGMVDTVREMRQTVRHVLYTSPRRRRSLVIRRILVLSAVLMVALAGTAHAQYVPGEPGIIVDPGTVSVGGTIEVQGSGCPRDSEVQIFVGDTLVATTHTA